ncbi:hypothetical protein ACVWXL_005798 [Bradyrhizobium sp. GM22.5]
MSPRSFSDALFIGALVSLLATRATAAVLILEGGNPSPSPSPPAVLTPAPAPAPAASAPSDSGPGITSSRPKLVPSPLPSETPSAPSRPPSAAASSTPTESSEPITPAVPTGTTAPAMLDLSGVTPSNQAELSVQMLPGQTVTVGSYVSFKITSKKPGYLVLIDVDVTGHLTQIYPNTAALARTNRTNGNLIKPGNPLTVPLPTDPYAGVRYLVSPPHGQAMVVGILSAAPVQILDLPDVPAEILGKPDMIVAYLYKRVRELRVPDEDNQLRESKWSFDARPYTIQ